ncbi:hypothetical protein QIH87_14220 [Bradyrhizobium elkanii]|uniref:hypothetical protein n=1 Tax=Bradyrhizobium elkanii TaxID=29448 RepID=UPI0010228257|nr:hypothetical protein [Bradyrhizobium elkanii]MCW2112486.1 hypothetical protein [Bradyrhizobium elkanii]MCW2199157.1 hypothetical protein [Bradyrhizobium elkanii]MCW2229290.1 hypothetical protein [Bradyrhizobium elkanii]NWL38102.1 hypothetical protein [Bradyrhizobium elkanii]RYM15734.1 hypothetical protein EWH13_38495 [Bradyrhizobium elkanii]
MNPAVYVMTFVGLAGTGGGCLYIGNGKIVGADTGGARYHGTYTEQNGALNANVRLTQATDGLLVTGVLAPKGTVIDLTATLSANFHNGQPQQIMVAGNPVNATFEKVGDV